MAGGPSQAEDDAIQSTLREHGRVDGENVQVERRFNNGNAELAAKHAAELVNLPVDVLLMGGSAATAAAKAATAEIPDLRRHTLGRRGDR